MSTPIDHVNKSAKILFVGSYFDDASSPAASMMETIATWSYIQSNITLIFSRMLRADLSVGTALFDQFQTAQARRKAIIATSKTVLPIWQTLALEAVFDATDKSMKARNAFAHQIIGYSPDIPKAILLVSPEEVTAVEVSRRTGPHPDTKSGELLTAKPIDRSKVYVWTTEDLRSALLEAAAAELMFELLRHIVGHPSVEDARRELWEMDAFQDSVQKLLRQRKADAALRAQMARPGDAPPAPGISRTWDESLGRDTTRWHYVDG